MPTESPGVEASAACAKLCHVATRLAAHDKVERDARVVSDRARGLTWPTISARHGLCERQCREVVRAHRASGPALDQHDPREEVQEALEQLESLVEQLALVVESSKHDAVRLGALKAQLAASGQRLALMQAVGILPRTLGLLRQDMDVYKVAHVVLDVFYRHDVSLEARQEVLAALQAGLVWQGGHSFDARNGGG